MQRRLWTLAGALLAALLLLGAMPAAAAQAFPEVITLPEGFRPEGIVAGRGQTAYVGSLANGAIYAADLKAGTGEILVEGEPGKIIVGIEFDPSTGYIYAAGGVTGKAYVYDSQTGAEIAEYNLAAPTVNFINDVVVTKDAAYFTNSRAALLYRVPLSSNGQPGAPDSVATIALSGDWVQGPGFNANGIEANSNGDTLIVVNSGLGKLYAVDAATGVAEEIDLGGESVSAGDGLLRVGNTLYVVRNQLNTIAAFKLSGDLSSATLLKNITSPNFAVPTTVTVSGGALYAVNARFGLTVQTPFTIVRVER